MMRREVAIPSRSRSKALSINRLYHRTRSIAVRVLVDGHEVDGFEMAGVKQLRAALVPVYRHLIGGRGVVEYTGIEDESLPLAIRRYRREITLPNLEAALHFLEPRVQ